MVRKNIKLIFVALLLAIGLAFWFLRQPHFDLNKLYLTIHPSELSKLDDLRKDAIEAGVLKRSQNDYVDCQMTYLNDSISGKVRLKGDWVDHLNDHKWSFRIKLAKPLENGIKTFSLQSPKSRDFLNGYVFHRLLKKHDVLSNEMFFVELIVNGDSWGIYNFEEHLSARMLRSHNRPEGLILNFEDDIFFDAVLNKEELIGLIKKAKIKVRGSERLKSKYPALTLEAEKIMSEYQLQTDSVYRFFNSNAMGKYYAICDLAQAYHAMGWINIRFYFNFDTRLMEPIAYDGYPVMEWGLPYLGQQAVKAIDTKQKYDQVKVVYSALYYPSIKEVYETYLNQIVDEKEVLKFLQGEKDKIDHFEKEIQKEFNSYEYDRTFLINNAERIRLALEADR